MDKKSQDMDKKSQDMDMESQDMDKESQEGEVHLRVNGGIQILEFTNATLPMKASPSWSFWGTTAGWCLEEVHYH